MNNIKLENVISINKDYSRSINLLLDSENDRLFKLFIPTTNLVKLFSSICNSILVNKSKSRVLVGPYGSGKSLFSSILTQILKHGKSDVVNNFFNKITSNYPELSEPIVRFSKTDNTLYPFIITGYHGDLSTTILKTIEEVAKRETIQIDSVFSSIKNIINNWESEYPDAYNKFSELIKPRFPHYTNDIELNNHNFVSFFESIYPKITNGAELSLYKQLNPINALQSLTDKLCNEKGFKGLFIIYDEFGLFLNKAVENRSIVDFSLLQDIAEYCDRSPIDKQIHLNLITHKSISNYMSGMDHTLSMKWKAIEGRFNYFDISSDPDTLSNIINNVINKNDTLYNDLISQNKEAIDYLLNNPGQLTNIFPDKLNEELIKKVFPLHPVSSFMLPRLSLQFGQNERTLFSFLGIDDEYSLSDFIKNNRDFTLLTPDILYDYFESLIMCDIGHQGKHNLVYLSNNIIKKLSNTDPDLIRIIKTIALFQIIDLPDFKIDMGIVAYSLFREYDKNYNETIIKKIKKLIKEKHITERQESLRLISKSIIDLDEEMSKIPDSFIKPSRLSSLLNDYIPKKYFIPRKYNSKNKMTRYFPVNVYSIDQFRSFLSTYDHDTNINDGLVIFCLPFNNEELSDFKGLSSDFKRSKIIFIIPNTPLSISKQLIELQKLNIIYDDETIHSNDQNIISDIKFFIDNARDEIRDSINEYFSIENNTIIIDGVIKNDIKTIKQLEEEVSTICSYLYPYNFIVNVEVFNKESISKVQERALISVLDIVLNHKDYSEDLIKSGGPEDLIYKNTVLFNHLSYISNIPNITSINTESFKKIHEQFNLFISKAVSWTDLIQRLKISPFGLRSPVITLLVSILLKPYLNSIAIFKDNILIDTFSPETFLDSVNNSNIYRIETYKILEDFELLKSDIVSVFNDFVTDKEVTTSKHLHQSLIRFYQSIPRYTRESKSLNINAKSFLELIRNINISDAEMFNEALPSILTEKSTYKDSLRFIKNSVDENFDLLYEKIADIFGNVFNISNISFINFKDELSRFFSSVKDEKLNISHSNTTINNFLSLKSTLVDLSNRSLLNQLAVIITGVSLNDWSEQTISIFRNSLSEIKQDIFEDTNVQKNTFKYKLFINDEEYEREYVDVELSPVALQLKSMIENRIMGYKGALSDNEKKKIIIQILKEM